MYTKRLKQTSENKSSSKPFFGAQPKKDTLLSSNIQRKCTACEQEETLRRQETSEEEESVQMIPMPFSRLQRRDVLEEEEVQAMPLMRKSKGGGYSASPQLTTQLSQSKGGGSSLPKTTLTQMNHAFGTDFSQVRIHKDSQAQEMSQGIQAKAFTHGADIYFNRGQYQPESSDGKKLLAHELTHVVQQNEKDKSIQKSDTSRSRDPCSYDNSDLTQREIHLNIGNRTIRVYQRNGNNYSVALEFRNIIVGPATWSLARAQSDSNPWCHLYRVQGHQEYTSKGLINFVNYCGEFGFHSNYWRKFQNGQRRIRLIPGSESHGCARIIDPSSVTDSSMARDFSQSRRFYNLVQNGDCVRIYSRTNFRAPTFSRCRDNGNCNP